MRNIFSIVFLIISVFSYCQEGYYSSNSRWTSIRDSIGEIKFQILTKWQEGNSFNDSFIFWYDRGKIHINQGSYSGYLLNGTYLAYNNHSNLIEKGKLINGKKVGIWYKWDNRGNRTEKSFWRNGFQNGETIVYNDSLVVYKKFSNNKLKGWTKIYNAKSQKLIRKEKYNNDELIRSTIIKQEKKNGFLRKDKIKNRPPKNEAQQESAIKKFAMKFKKRIKKDTNEPREK